MEQTYAVVVVRPTWRRSHREVQGRNYDTRTLNPLMKNPVDNTSQITRCTVCESIYHWMGDCSHSSGRQPPITFIGFTNSSIQECYNSKLAGETLSGGLLDCACTKTVRGKEWFNDFESTLSDEDGLVRVSSSKVWRQ